MHTKTEKTHVDNSSSCFDNLPRYKK